MNQIQNKYAVLGSLCALVLMLVVGYAAFSTVLKVKGTSTINSNWDVRITDIQEGEKTGMASTSVYEEGDKAGQKIMEYEDLTATFSADLKSPGDFIEYNITVSNEGSLNAKLDKITISDPDNEYITFETSGLTEGMLLESKTSETLKVKVIFKDVTINKSEPSTSKLTVTLDFSQAEGSGAVEPEPDPEPGFTGTVYRNSTDHLNIGDSIKGITTSASYDELEYQSTYYLKHDVVDNKITASYVCLITTKEICLQGGSTDYYEPNKALLESQKSWVESQPSSYNPSNCSGSDSYYSCSIGRWNTIYAFSTGKVSSEDPNGSTCSVNDNGESYC